MSRAEPDKRPWWRLWLGLAGLAWAVFAASRWAVVMVIEEGGGLWYQWLWPAWWQPAATGLAVLGLCYLTWVLQAKWLEAKGLTMDRAQQKAALAWLPSLALLLIPLWELTSPLYRLSLAPLALGREAWPVAALAVAAAVGLQTWLAAPAAAPKAEAARTRPWLAPLVFMLALALFAAVGLRLTVVSQKVGKFMAGDEPQYLLIAHSLAADHDLDLSNNIHLRDNAYYQDPDKVIGGHGAWSGQRTWISKHRPGLPLLMAPFYAWGLYSGVSPRKLVTVLFWLLGAWMVAEVFLLARLATGSQLSALGAAAMTGLSLPLLLYANLAFPEMAGAALSMAAFRRLWQAGLGQWGLLLWAGLFTAYLPWLSERFIIIALLLGLYCLQRGHWRRIKDLCAFFGPALVSALLLAYYFITLYGSPLPSLEVHGQGRYLNPRGAWEGLSGLWVDGAEGLLIYGPIWLAAAAGLIWLLRRRGAGGWWLASLVLAMFLAAGLYVDWFGGEGPPSRYLVAALPFLAVGLAAGLKWGPPRLQVLWLVMAGLSLAASLWVLTYPPDVYRYEVVLDRSLQFPLLEGLLPAYIFRPEAAGANAGLGLIWMLLLVLTLLVMSFGRRRFNPAASLAGLVAAFLLVAGAAVAADDLAGGKLVAGKRNQTLALYMEHGAGQKVWRPVSPRSGQPNLASLMQINIPPADYLHKPARRAQQPPGAVLMRAGVKPQLFIWGQYFRLPPGRYRALALIKGAYTGPSGLGWIDVTGSAGQKTLARKEISASDLNRPLRLEFRLENWDDGIELRVGTSGLAALKVQSLAIQCLGPGRSD